MAYTDTTTLEKVPPTCTSLLNTTNGQSDHSSHRQRVSSRKRFTQAWQRLATFSRTIFVFKHQVEHAYSMDSLAVTVNDKEKHDSTVIAPTTMATAPLDSSPFPSDDPMLLDINSEQFESMSDQEQRAYVQAYVDLSGFPPSLYL